MKIKHPWICIPGLFVAAIAAICPAHMRAQSSTNPGHNLPDGCLTIEVRSFYPGQAGSQMYWLTNNCGARLNVSFATQGMTVQSLNLATSEGHFTGYMGRVPGKYKVWYCAAPSYPSDAGGNLLNGSAVYDNYDTGNVYCK
jgi:hypothetical protein